MIINYAKIEHNNPPKLNLNDDDDILKKMGYGGKYDLEDNLLKKFDLLKKRPQIKEMKVNTELLEILSKKKPQFLSAKPKLDLILENR